eukprot:1868296-Pleurochrysis_carterae.AAC.1
MANRRGTSTHSIRTFVCRKRSRRLRKLLDSYLRACLRIRTTSVRKGIARRNKQTSNHATCTNPKFEKA